MGTEEGVGLRPGWVASDLAAEFPELALQFTAVEARSGRSPQSVKERLRTMSNRFTGPRAVHMRQEPIPWAYRVFFRQVGIDPDEHRTPIEHLTVERMKWGAFRSRNLLDDGLLIATIETGVPVVAFDADRVEGDLGLRLAGDAERLGAHGRPLSIRQIVIADELRALAVLFGEIAEDRGVTPETERIVLAALKVKGVPQISVEEAVWTVLDVLRSTG
jgi:DNA/RNA-binding domain of Phe-tRNA-synthetase-like protein